MNEQLSHWVIGCECVADTDEALRVLREAARTANPYQIAIFDHHMPVMNGEMLGQSIKKIPDLKDTALVMLTSVGQRGEAARFKEIGFSACLVKPVRRLQLKEILSTVWGGVQQRLNSPMVKRHTLAESTSDGQGNSTCRDTGHVAHVLVADDNIVNQKAASRNLEKLGCKVELVDNGQEALDAVMKNSYDLVFMDCQMPVLDGLDATRAIRSQVPGGDKLRIVAMTANALQGDRGKCLDAGADDFITKPDR